MDVEEATRKKFSLDDQIRIAMEVFHEKRFYADTTRGDCLYKICNIEYLSPKMEKKSEKFFLSLIMELRT